MISGPDLEPPPAQRAIKAFVNVTVVPMDAPRLLTGHTVLIEGETITAIGPVEQVSVPAEAEQIDGTERFLMPGLTDMHTHLGTNFSEFINRKPPEEELQAMAEGQLFLYLANGVTTILNNGDFGEPLIRWRDEVRAGQYPGPTIYAAQYARGPAGTPDGGPSNRAVTDAVDAHAFTLQSKAEGFDFMKVYNYTPADAFKAIVETGRAQGMATIGHLPQTLSAFDALTGGLVMVAHAEAYMWTLFDNTLDPVRIPASRTQFAIDMTVQSGAFVTSTLGIVKTISEVWGGNEAGIAAFWARPENQYMHWSERALHEQGLNGPRWHPATSRPGGYTRRYEFIQQYTRAFYDAGVTLLAGTDSPTVLGVAGFSIHDELAALRDLGLSPYEVLRIATHNGGIFIERYVDEPLRFGTVAAGERADLLLLEANPLDDLAHVQQRVAVMARGRLYREEYIQRGLAEIAAAYADQ